GFQDRALAGGKFSETVDYATENGNIHFLLSYNPIYQNDRITGISMFVEDITELKTYQEKLEKQTENLENTVQSRTSELQEKNVQLEVTLRELEEAQERLVQSEKMASLGILAAGIGHEINNPLNFIKNGAAALLLKLKEREIILDEFNPFFQIIETGVSRANNIVKSLSHFSREVKSMEELCDINAVLDNCLTILYGTYKDKISITKNLDSDIPKVFGNEGKLHQVFLNLLSNAEQAIVEQGEIVITTKYDENRLIVTIADNGCGISPSNLSKISDPFFTTKSPGEGTGLGLYIAYNIIEEHNGEIRVKSKLSEGTIFIVELKINK
ncbi:MAG: signal transduction histidine kinase, partial [Marivirga sp.]